MPVATQVFTKWNPTRLNHAIQSAFPKSVRVAQADAKSRLHNKSKSDVGARVTNPTNAVLYGKGLANAFEKGRKPGYDILPGAVKGNRRSYSRTKGETFRNRKKRGGTSLYLSFPGPKGNNIGGVTSVGVKGGKMGKYPAMGPAGQDWARRGYQTVAKMELARAGYGVRAVR